MTDKKVEVDLVKARQVGKTIEFIATFGSIFIIQLFFGTFLISLISGIVAYAIVNGVLEFNLQSIKSKLGL